MVSSEIQKNADFLLSLAISKCNSFADAEDLVQEAVLAAISYEANGNVIENTEAFLRTIFHRKFSDWLRRKYQRPEVTLSPEQETVSDEDFVNELVRKEEAENVRREVAYLSEAYRTAIVRHYFNGKSVSEISRELGIPEGTVKSRLNFGRQQLKKRNLGYEKLCGKQLSAPAPARMQQRKLRNERGADVVDGRSAFAESFDPCV